jgi:hypothetical protein
VRTLSSREKALLALVALAAVALVARFLASPAGMPAIRGVRSEPLPPPIPRIELSRLQAERADAGAGKRDLFRFGSASRSEDEDEAPEVVPERTPPPAPVYDPAAVAAASLPQLNLKYLGSVENRSGIKVAVLLTDRKEVLTGQAGETVANRYRIARIGLESVDLEDVASGQSRRIPLRGN